MTKERIVLLAVLAVGGMALLVDRLILSNPGPSLASADAVTAASVTVAPAVTPSNAAPPPEAQSGESTAASVTAVLARRLEEVAQAQLEDKASPRDAFTIAPTWMQVKTPQQQQADPVNVELERFARKYKLNAVLARDNGAIAIVNGQPLAVGQTLDGFTLEEVRKRSVVFRQGMHRMELSLSSPEK